MNAFIESFYSNPIKYYWGILQAKMHYVIGICFPLYRKYNFPYAFFFYLDLMLQLEPTKEHICFMYSYSMQKFIAKGGGNQF